MDSLLSKLDKILENTEFTQKYDYSCSMVDLCPKVKLKIRDWINKNIDRDFVFWGDDSIGELGIELNPHITIVYGYHTNSLINIAESFSEYTKDHVDIIFGKINIFHHENYDVLYIEVKSKDVIKLRNLSIASGLDITESYSSYTPHCTLAYLKNDTKNQYSKQFIGSTFFENLQSRSDQIRVTTADGKKTKFSLNYI